MARSSILPLHVIDKQREFKMTDEENGGVEPTTGLVSNRSAGVYCWPMGRFGAHNPAPVPVAAAGAGAQKSRGGWFTKRSK